ncbi:MAG TPA: ABC transporter permease [Chloroflexota bacterium]|jgi:peptide/nickel transport system permease protein|nr:ABC transporter permease [Chloroflexota bacterium]
MGAYLIHRVVGVLVVVLGVLTISFFLVSMIPGDVAVFYAGPHASGQVIAETRHALGLDQPKYIQYFKYLWQTLQGNLGQSATLDEPVSTALFQRLPQTAMLAGVVILLEMVVMLIFGTLSAVFEDSPIDRLTAAFAAIGISLPGFWVGTVLLFVVGYKLSWLPLGGYGDPVIEYLILPAVTVGVPGGFWYARILRASLTDTLHTDYVRTARSKGLARRQVVIRHALPNAIIPVITIAAMDLGQLLGGIVVVETVFSWPGVGFLAFNGVQNLDVPLVVGTTIFTALCIALLNIVADLLRLVIDPRVRLA